MSAVAVAAVAAQEPIALSAAEVAGLLGMSESHLFNLIKQGKFGPAPRRLGRAVRYSRQEVQEWFDAGSPPAYRWAAVLKARQAG